MRIFAHLDENNNILGWYNDLVHGIKVEAVLNENKEVAEEAYIDLSNIPTPNKEVVKAVWLNALKNNHNRLLGDGTTEYIKSVKTLRADFRHERDLLLNKCDIEINKALDNGLDVIELRKYRQALRDATIKWVMPTNILN